MKRSLFTFILFSVCLLVNGCQLVHTGINKVGYQKIDEVNAKIAQLETKAATQIEELNVKWRKDLEEVVKLNTAMRQGAANELFAADFSYTLHPNPDRNAVVVNYHVKAAIEYIRIAPSPEAIAKHLKEVKDELDVTKTTIADLQKKYEAEKTKADAIVAEKAKVEAEIATIAQQKIEVENAKNKEITTLQAAKDKSTKDLLDKQQADLDAANDRKALILTLMRWSGGLTLLAIIGAVYIPVMRREAIILAAILGGITVSLPFIELWMIGVCAGIVVVGLIAWMIYKHHYELQSKDKELTTEKTISGNLVNVIQDVKEKSKELFDSQIKPSLQEWNTKYVKQEDGKTIKVEDKTVMDAIDKKLVETQRL